MRRNATVFVWSTPRLHSQAYDFEASFACYNGSFALGGFLPVVPGPCGLYRKSDICGKAADWYFDIVNQSPAETGMLLGNLRIAEDRVLSYSVVLKTDDTRNMGLVPEAVFYFEAELELQRLMLQVSASGRTSGRAHAPSPTHPHPPTHPHTFIAASGIAPTTRSCESVC